MKVTPFITEDDDIVGVTCVFEPKDFRQIAVLLKVVEMRLPEYTEQINEILTDLIIAKDEGQDLIVSLRDTTPFDVLFEELEAQFRVEDNNEAADKTKRLYLQVKSKLAHGNA